MREWVSVYNNALSNLCCINWSETDGSDVKHILKSAFTPYKNHKPEIIKKFFRWGKMNRKYFLIGCFIFLVLALCGASFSLGFVLNRSKKSYDFNNILFIPKTENPKYTFLEPELSDYICALCDGLKLDPDLAVAHLLVENPDFNPDAIHKNDNGTVDLGLFQLNDKYLWTTFRNDYWFDNVELDPFNWKHNTYIALHLMADLHKQFKVQDDAIMAYNGGRGAVMNGTVKPFTYEYLRKVNNNYMLLKNCEKESVKE